MPDLDEEGRGKKLPALELNYFFPTMRALQVTQAPDESPRIDLVEVRLVMETMPMLTFVNLFELTNYQDRVTIERLFPKI
ncbi:hypothetical protein BGX23_007934, partial [Mortierella sp. AD031]